MGRSICAAALRAAAAPIAVVAGVPGRGEFVVAAWAGGARDGPRRIRGHGAARGRLRPSRGPLADHDGGIRGRLALAFLAVVRLYRAMPTRMRQAIEIVDEDDDAPQTSPAASPSTPLSHEALAALDAKFASPPDHREPGT